MSNRAFTQLLIAALERNIPADAAAMLRRGELPPQDILVQWLLFALLLRFEDVLEENKQLRDFIKNELRAIRRDIKASAKKVVTEMTTAKMSDYEKSGPRNAARKRQVNAVIERLSKYASDARALPLVLMNKNPNKWIHQACMDAWFEAHGGYPNTEALYRFCKRNYKEVLALAGM